MAVTLIEIVEMENVCIYRSDTDTDENKSVLKFITKSKKKKIPPTNMFSLPSQDSICSGIFASTFLQTGGY